MKNQTQELLQKISRIRRDKGFSQEYVAELLKISASAYSKLENGKLELAFSRLSDLADIYKMSVIDLIAYPKQYVDIDSIKNNNVQTQPELEAVLQIKLNTKKKEQILSLIFGDNNLDLLTQ